jgi:hypothetical protein
VTDFKTIVRPDLRKRLINSVSTRFTEKCGRKYLFCVRVFLPFFYHFFHFLCRAFRTAENEEAEKIEYLPLWWNMQTQGTLMFVHTF